MITHWNGLPVYRRAVTPETREAYFKVARIIRYLDEHDDGQIYPETFDILANARHELAEYYC